MTMTERRSGHIRPLQCKITLVYSYKYQRNKFNRPFSGEAQQTNMLSPRSKLKSSRTTIRTPTGGGGGILCISSIFRRLQTPYLISFVAFVLGVYVGSLQSMLHHHHHHQPGIDTTTAEAVLSSFLEKSSSSPLKNDSFSRDVQELQQSLASCQQMRQEQESSEKFDSFNEEATPESPQQHQRHAICRRLSRAFSSSSSSSSSSSFPIIIPSSMQVWTSFLKRIHRASQLTFNDPKYLFHDYTAQLLQIITPRLPRSITSLPREWQRVELILTKLEKRYTHIRLLQQQQQQGNNNNAQNTTLSNMPIPPPVKIVILGGSVLVGRNCRKLYSDMKLQMTLPNRHCTYSNRLQVFLNQIFSPNNTLLYQHQSKKYNTNTNHQREPPPPSISMGAISLFDVTKIAMGGTNTAVGSQVLQYDLLPLQARQPDIILNAYSTNDMHILTILEAASKGNISLRQRVFDMTQDFVRAVMDPNSDMAKMNHQNKNDNGTCHNNTNNDNKDNKNDNESSIPPPLLLHMDDYLGNEQREILATTELAQGVGVLAQYYGFATMSYANLVRDIVYSDSYESWFSPQGWWPSQSEKRQDVEQAMEREIHPNMGMHIVATWVVVYNLLHLVTTFCSIQNFLPSDPTPSSNNNNKPGGGQQQQHHQPDWPDYKDSIMAQIIPLNGNGGSSEAPGKPKFPLTAVALPPYLNETLSLEHITQEWNRIAQEQATTKTASSSALSSSSTCSAPLRCPFSWVSGLSLEQNNKTYIQQLFDTYAVSGTATSWKLSDDGGKLGFVPSKIGDSVQLQFDQVPQVITTVTFFILKSYGPKWENSQMTVNIATRTRNHHHNEPPDTEESSWLPLLTLPRQLEGIHGKETSEMYTEPIVLPRAVPTGDGLRVTYELTGGQTFKLMGLAVCS